jgi:hypothetical protein
VVWVTPDVRVMGLKQLSSIFCGILQCDGAVTGGALLSSYILSKRAFPPIYDHGMNEIELSLLRYYEICVRVCGSHDNCCSLWLVS